MTSTPGYSCEFDYDQIYRPGPAPMRPEVVEPTAASNSTRATLQGVAESDTPPAPKSPLSRRIFLGGTIGLIVGLAGEEFIHTTFSHQGSEAAMPTKISAKPTPPAISTLPTSSTSATPRPTSSPTPSPSSLSAYKIPGISTDSRAIMRPGRETNSPEIWLTFDDHDTRPDGKRQAEAIPRILEVLRQTDSRAIFFPIGNFAKKYPDIIEAMKWDGHYIGNHSMTHPDLTKVTFQSYLDDIKAAEEVVQPNTFPMLLRPPYGRGLNDTGFLEKMAQLGYQVAGWTNDSRDWEEGMTPETIYKRTIEGSTEAGKESPAIAKGQTLLFHMSTPTFQVLERIILEIYARKMGTPSLR